MPDWMTHMGPDLLAFFVSLGVLGTYHGYLFLRLRANPHYTIQSVNSTARSSWVSAVMADPSQAVLAVQTLRNSTMAATFLASTAVLLIIGVLNLGQAGNDNILTSVASHHYGALLQLIKLTPLLLVLFAAFLFFTLAIRMYNHVGYLINSRLPACTPVYVARILNRGGAYYSLGMRSYYLAVPFIFWLFGPVFMLLASVAMVAVLYHIDRAPDAEAGDVFAERAGASAALRGRLAH